MLLHESLDRIFPAEEQIPPEVRLDKPLVQDTYLVNGELRRWTGAFEDIYSPVYTSVAGGPPKARLVGRAPQLGEAEALEVLEAAVRAWDRGRGAWPTLPVAERIRCMERFVYKMRERRSEVVKLLMWEIGKSLPDSQKEFDRTVDYIKDTVEALKDLDRASSRFTIEGGIIGQIRRAPLGVTLCMGPFNYPLNETYTTLIPALIMGNTVVFKPPRFGILLHQPIMEAFRECFPPGVVNAVYGVGRTVIPPLMASGKVDCLAFIGTSPVADSIKKGHPKPHRLRSVLGLEAKNPAIVLADADLDLAVSECVLGALSFNGQRCTALKILLVQRGVADAFLGKLSAAVSALPGGMPWEKDVRITPLPEPNKAAYLSSLIEDAARYGGRVVNPGGGMSQGSFFVPAIVYPVSPQAKLYRDEQFGPVIPVVPFDEIEEVIEYMHESNYGQQVSVFGRDPATVARMIDPLANQVCRINLNSQCQRGPDTFPFTGRKDSAEGTLSVSDALRVFTIRTLVAAKEGELNKEILGDIVRERRSAFLSTDYIF